MFVTVRTFFSHEDIIPFINFIVFTFPFVKIETYERKETSYIKTNFYTELELTRSRGTVLYLCLIRRIRFVAQKISLKRVGKLLRLNHCVKIKTWRPPSSTTSHKDVFRLERFLFHFKIVSPPTRTFKWNRVSNCLSMFIWRVLRIQNWRYINFKGRGLLNSKIFPKIFTGKFWLWWKW